MASICNPLFLLARPPGFEPGASRFVVWHYASHLRSLYVSKQLISGVILIDISVYIT